MNLDDSNCENNSIMRSGNKVIKPKASSEAFSIELLV